MSLEIVKNKENEIFDLLVDGKEVFDAKLNFDPFTGQYTCEINSEESAIKLINYDSEELLIFRKIKLKPLITFDSKVKLDLYINLKRKYSKEELKQTSIFIYINPDHRYWNNVFTYQDYEELLLPELENLRKIENVLIFRTKDVPPEYKQFVADNNELEFMITADLEATTIADSISEFIRNFINVDKKIYNQLKAKHSFTNLNSSFLFPPELKTFCEQYLLYFAQFLKDLGISATSNIKEEAGKVLFSVTPNNDIEALDKIREALAIYLNLPASPIVYDDSFAAMRLQQQIEYLQYSQKMAAREIRAGERELLLAQTVIEQQDHLIRQKDTTIEQQNRIIEKITSKSIMMDSLENKEEFVEVFEGLKVGSSKFVKEQIGIEFNPALTLKTIGKALIGKEEIISIVDSENDSDEENN